MKRALKIPAYCAAGLLVLLAVAAVTVRIYFPPEKIRRLALEYAARQLNREVRISSASVGLGGVTLKNLEVSESPDFSRGEFLKAGDFQVSLRLLPLLHGKIELRSVNASGVSVLIKQHRRGIYNFSDLMTAPSPPAEAAKPTEKVPAKAALPFLVSQLTFENSSLAYEDEVSRMKLRFDKLQIKARDISIDRPFDLQCDFTMNVKSPYFTGTIPVRAELKTDAAGGDLKKSSVKIRKLRVSLDRISAEISGSIANLTEPEAALSLKIDPFSTSDLKKWLPSVPARIPLPGIKAESSFKAFKDSVTLKSLSAKAGPLDAKIAGSVRWSPKTDYRLRTEFKASLPETDSSEIARKFPSVPKKLKIPPSELSGRADISPEKISMESLKLRLGAIKASGSADVSFRKQGMNVSVFVKAEEAPLDEISRILPLLKPYELGGKISGEIKYSMLKSAMSCSGTLNLADMKASYSGRSLSGIGGPLAFTTDMVKAGPLTGKLDGADFKASFSAADFTRVPRLFFDAELSRLNLTAPAGPGLPADTASRGGPPVSVKTAKTSAVKAKKAATEFIFDLSGKAAIGEVSHPNFTGKDIVFSCDLKNVTADMTKLTGKASFEVRGGTLQDLSELAKSSAFGKVLLFPILTLQKVSRAAKVRLLPDFDNISYTIIEGDYDFQKGIMKIAKSRMDSSIAKVSSSGSVNLPAETLDLRIDTRLLPASGIKVSEPIGMTVKGTLANPSVRPDAASIMRQPEVQKAVEKGIEQGKKLLEKLLK